MSNLDQQADYVIVVEGHVGADLVGWSGPVSISGAVEEGGRSVTRLSGIVTDQAGLVGLVRHLHGLGVVLLAIERLASRP